jgi:uncharacterized protein (UPF0276 family)
MLPAIGYGIRRENRPFLDDPAINAGEITLEHAADPLRVDNFLGRQAFDYVSVHALELSVASPVPPPRAYLELLKTVAEENGADAVSDHLGFTRDMPGGVGMGHFAPPPFTPEALDATCRNVERIQKAVGGRPFFLENIAYLFLFQGTMTEAEFLSRVLSRTGCGWLLDVTNTYANARNHGYDARDFIRAVMPTAKRVQMHLAGGYLDEETSSYVDSHSEPIADDIWELYRFALEQGRGKVDAVFIERDDNYPDEQGWRGEARTARLIAWEVEEALPCHAR